MAPGEAGNPEDPDSPPVSRRARRASRKAGSAPQPPPKRRPIWLAFLAAAVTGLAVIGLWNRQSDENDQLTAVDSPGGLFQAATAEGTSLAAVGRATGLAFPCTAWLVDVGAPDSAGAYAVTTGACAGATDPAQVVSDQQVGGASVAFHAFAPLTSTASAGLVEVAVEEIEWASVRATDLAVLRLGSSYQDLAAQGIRPIRPVPPASEGAEILVAGVPVEGVPDNELYLRGSRCQAGPTVQVLADPWLWDDLQSSGCSGILDGSQGSVVFNEAGEAMGMVNASTIAAGQGPDCTLERPCEVAGGAYEVAPDRSYAVAVGGLADCFPEGEFAVGGTCPLEDPATVVAATAASRAAPPGAQVEIEVEEPRPGTGTIRVTSGDLAETDCRDPKGWSRLGDPPHNVTMPEEEGFALVCVGSAEQPTQIVVVVDGTPPDPGAIELSQTSVQGGVLVEPVGDPPELSGFRWVAGPQGAIDCAVAEGYVRYRGEPAMIQNADVPSTVCVIGIDAAGNESAPSAHSVDAA